MSKPEIIAACKLETLRRGGPSFTRLPFGEENNMRNCVHADLTTYAVAEFQDRRPVGVIALLGPTGGVYCALDSAELRDVARGLSNMADQIDTRTA